MASSQYDHRVLRLLIRPLLISGFLLHSALLAVSHAQVTTAITSDGTLGTTVTQAGNVYDINEGTIRGTNQFHSFDLFSVGAGDIASFNGPAGIENILSRVTGGQTSNIFGTLRSAIDGANLFLLNPAGVLFGPDATLDVSGSFHVSTADFLRLGDAGILYADLSDDSVLSVAPPSAFGFLSADPASIRIDQSLLQVPVDETLSVGGGDIEVVGGFLLAPSGRINITSVASAGEVIPNAPGEAPDLNVDSFERLGSIDLSLSAFIDAGGDGGGTVVIRGGRLMVTSSEIFASTKGPVGGPFVGDPGAGIDIQVAEDVVLDNGAIIGTNVFSGVAEDSGGVRIRADHLEVRNGADIESVAFFGSSGNSGNIEVDTNSVLIRDGGFLGANTGGSGDAGEIIVNTGSFEVRDRGIIFTVGFAGSGNGGGITVNAESMVLSNTSAPGFLTGITTQTFGGTGKAGDVRVVAESLQILESAEISTPTFGLGNGGNIEVMVDSALISGSNTPGIFTGIFANTFGSGRGGNLDLTANSLEMINKASIQVRTLGPGDAGNATVRAGSLELRDASFISASALFGWGGNGGNLEVIADSLFISGPESSPDPFGVDFTGLSTVSGPVGGRGGDLHIATDSLVLTNRGSISSSSFGPDRGGDIEVNAGSFEVLDGSAIMASAFGSGSGGNIEVMADRVLLSGVNNEPFTDITGNTALSPSGIASQTGLFGGSAGSVRITAGALEVLDGARLSTETFGPGDGGNIEVMADSVLIAGVNADLREFLSAAGADPKFASAALLTSTNGAFLGDAATGNAGDMLITAKDLQVRDGGLISSETETPGAGGNIEITITASQVQLSNGARISAESSGAGNTGRITITAGDTFRSENSSVTTGAKQADGGDIFVTTTGSLLHLIDSEITTSVESGVGKGGNITIHSELVVLSNSRIRADAFGGPGGTVTIVADVYLPSLSLVSASSALAEPGTIDIQASITDVSGSLAQLPEAVLQAAALLRASCAARLAEGEASSLVLAGHGGLPLEPGGLLPSPLLAEGPAEAGLSSSEEPQWWEPFPRFSRLSLDPKCSR